MQDAQSSPVRNRRRAVDTSNNTALTESPWAAEDVFTSALSSTHTTQRRLRSGSKTSERPSETQGLSASGWQDGVEDEDQQESPSRSRSNGKPTGSTIKSLAALVFHPLTPPTETAPLPPLSSTSTPIKSRHSHEVASPFSDGSIGRRRNYSDGNYESYSKAMAGVGVAEGKAKDKGKGKMMEEQCEVIAHEVQPTDSLAGVALKYGVQIADIRKANKLWASDTIHLRKTLYIPIDSVPDRSSILASVQEEDPPSAGRVAGASENRQPPSESQNGWPEDKTSRHLRDASSGSGSGGGTPSRSLERRTLAVATIRRVPASELSFFPPPSGNSQRDPSASKFDSGLGSTFPITAIPDGSSLAFPLLPSAFSSSSNAAAGMISSSLRGLPSLFNTSLPTLPTMSSPRISFSSEGTSEQSSDVEMDDLGWQKQISKMANGGAAPRRKRGKLAEIDLPDFAYVSATSGLPPVGSVASTIRPASITTQFQGNSDTTSSSARLRVRNQQPAPSPMMALPGRSVKPL